MSKDEKSDKREETQYNVSSTIMPQSKNHKIIESVHQTAQETSNVSDNRIIQSEAMPPMPLDYSHKD